MTMIVVVMAERGKGWSGKLHCGEDVQMRMEDCVGVKRGN